MVVGIVIGSGIFFKAQDVLSVTAGDALSGVLAWLIGGAIMVFLSCTFAVMATRYERVNGVVDYAEATCGGTYAYLVGWFISVIYYPSMTSVLAWASARYTVVFVFGVSSISERALCGPECVTLAAFYLVLSYLINALSPRLAGRLQVSTTAIKLGAIALVALSGVIIGVLEGSFGEVLTASIQTNKVSNSGGMFAAICCTAFAYEGWIIATSINSEIKNSKRNLPIALVLGSLITVAAYLLYYVGVLGLEPIEVLMEQGTSAAFLRFGRFGSAAVNFFVVVSCLGTLHGLMLGTTRGIYSIATRDEFPSPIFSSVDKHTDMPNNSAAMGLFLCVLWFLYFMGSVFFGWFGKFGFDSSELPIITIYPLYIPILLNFMKKDKNTHPVKRYLLPILSILGSAVMVAASIFRHGKSTVWYLVVFFLIMWVGVLIRERKSSAKTEK